MVADDCAQLVNVGLIALLLLLSKLCSNAYYCRSSRHSRQQSVIMAIWLLRCPERIIASKQTIITATTTSTTLAMRKPSATHSLHMRVSRTRTAGDAPLHQTAHSCSSNTNTNSARPYARFPDVQRATTPSQA